MNLLHINNRALPVANIQTEAKMTTLRLILYWAIIVLVSVDTNEGSQSSCGSAVIRGPLDENGLPPHSKTLRATTNGTEDKHVQVKCQLMNISTDEMKYYNARLKIYFTCDRQVCVLRTHAILGEGCEGLGITYTYYEKGENGVMNYTYSIPWIDRLENSVITCGIDYHPVGNITQCFKDSAGLVTLEESLTCSLPETITENPTSSSNDQTTTDESTTNTSTTTTTTTGASTTTESTTNITMTEEPQNTQQIGSKVSTNSTDTPCPENNTLIYITCMVVEAVVIAVLIVVILILIMILKKVSLKSKFTERNLETSETIKNYM